MNILPHKSWHVRTKKNIERVRRDEAKAEREAKALEQRLTQIENERRIDLLKKRQGIQSSSKKDDQEISKKFELFEDFEDKITKDGEKSNEEKIENEKWQVRTGIFSYLDGRYKYDNQSANNEWYLKSREDRMNSEVDKNIKDERVKQMNDPLTSMKSYLSIMKKNEKIDLVEENRKKIESIKPDPSPSISRKRKKHKHKKRNLHADSSDSDSQSDPNSKKILIEKLRSERLSREHRERQRANELLIKNGLLDASSMNSLNANQPKQKYNAQFNPHLAKQNYS